MVPPSFNDDLGLTERVEDFAVQQFIPHSSVENFAVSVLPGRSGFDICGLGSNSVDPVSDSLSDELWAIVRPDVGRNPSQDEQVCKSVDDLRRVQLPFDPDRQAFPAVFVQDVQCTERPAIVSSVMNEVV